MSAFPQGYQERPHAAGPPMRCLVLWYRDNGVNLQRYTITWSTANYSDDHPELLEALEAKRDALIAQGFTVIETPDDDH